VAVEYFQENPDACVHDLALERMKGKESDMSRRLLKNPFETTNAL